MRFIEDRDQRRDRADVYDDAVNVQVEIASNGVVTGQHPGVNHLELLIRAIGLGLQNLGFITDVKMPIGEPPTMIPSA